MKRYFFFSKYDSNKELIGCVDTFSRLKAAKRFASAKHLTLKQFLSIYSVTR